MERRDRIRDVAERLHKFYTQISSHEDFVSYSTIMNEAMADARATPTPGQNVFEIGRNAVIDHVCNMIDELAKSTEEIFRVEPVGQIQAPKVEDDQ